MEQNVQYERHTGRTDKKYLTIREMAKYVRVGLSTAYEIIHRPGFPLVKLTAQKYIIPVDALDKWLNEQAWRLEEDE